MMNPEPNMAQTGLEKYPILRIIVGNLIMFLGIVVGTIAMWFVYPLLAGLYLVISVLVVYVVMRKLVCTNCYYYDKWCSMGWGKLAGLMFKKGNIEKFNMSIGVRLAPLVYATISFLPIIAVILLLVVAFDYYKLLILVVLLFFAVYSASIGRKTACTDCKMRLHCKGSTAKQ